MQVQPSGTFGGGAAAGVPGGGAPPQEAVGVRFSAEEERRMTSFLEGSVSELTLDDYQRHWALWVGFLADWRNSDDVALVELETPTEKAKVVLLFVVYLYTDCNRREEKVTEVLSAVRHFLVTVHRQDVGFLSLEVMRKAKQACRRSTEEVRDRQDTQEANAIIPFCLEIVVALREKLWVRTEWDHDGVLLKALWIAIGLGTDQGCRPSNLVQKDGKKAKDHTLRNSRVTFLLDGGGVATAGPAMKGVDLGRVLGVKIKLSTHKAGVDSSAGVRVGDGAGPHLARDLAEWAVYWADRGLAQDDDHFCRLWRMTQAKDPVMKGKTVTAKELRTAIKEGCGDFGLPTAVFGAKSMRKKMATDDRLRGVDPAETNLKGRWSLNANTARRSYSLAGAVRGQGAEAQAGEGKGEGLSLEEVRGLAGAAMAAKAKAAPRAKAAPGAKAPRAPKK